MIEIRLQHHVRPDGTLELRLPISFRILFAALAVVLAIGMIGPPQIGLLPSVILLILVMGSMYEERWYFDPNTKQIIARHGLLIFNRKRTWNYSDVASISTSFYLSGSVPGTEPPREDESHSSVGRGSALGLGRNKRFFQRPQLKYGLILTSGQIIRIEIRRVRDTESKTELPELLSHHLGVPIEEQKI